MVEKKAILASPLSQHIGEPLGLRKKRYACQTKYAKPNMANQPTKHDLPTLPTQTYQTEPPNSNIPNQTKPILA